MSRIGKYRKIANAAKKLGGTGIVIGAVAVGGYALYRAIDGLTKADEEKEDGFEPCAEQEAEAQSEPREIMEPKVYPVVRECASTGGVNFHIGDLVKAFDRDGDAVLIKKLGDNSDPFWVSTDLMKTMTIFS